MRKDNTISEEDRQAREAYYVAFALLRAKLDEVERACVDDDTVRSAVSIAVENYTTQLEALRQSAVRKRKRRRSN